MPVPELFAAFLRPLNQLDFPYMVTGAVAAIVYGEPRLTHDLDIVLDLRPGDGRRLIAAFPETEFYRPPGKLWRKKHGASRTGTSIRSTSPPP